MEQQFDWMHRFHLGEHSVEGSGVFETCRGEHWPGRLVGALLRFPETAQAVSVRVRIVRSCAGDACHTPGVRHEHWVRHIGTRRLTSIQTRDGDVIRERFGPIEIRMRWSEQDGLMRLSPEGASVCLGKRRVRLPYYVAPRACALVWSSLHDSPVPAKFSLRVRIWTPVTGLLLSYTGHIEESTDG